MSGGRRSATPIVSRAYRPKADYCARALRILLNQSVMKMAAKHSQPVGPDDVRKDLDAHTATQHRNK